MHLFDEPSLGLALAMIASLYETFVRLHKEGLTLLAEQSVDLALEVASLRLRAAGAVACFARRASCRTTPTVQRICLEVG
jgi:branched-chain amino acid transport system ATP-binding protein